MDTKKVKQLEPADRLVYWIKERHRIHTRRQAGKPKPWTDDRVLQTVFFTNPFRENDKTTVWFRENIRDPLDGTPEVLTATVIFRWFNLIKTGELLLDTGEGEFGLLDCWDKRLATRTLVKAWDNGNNPVFTGAYMIKAGNGPRGSKIPSVCKAIDHVHRDRNLLLAYCEHNSLQVVWQALKQYRGLGGFMSYEIVTDLRHTYLLNEAEDIYTWANPGPGAQRGLARLEGFDRVPGKNRYPKVKDPVGKMRDLLKIVSRKVKIPGRKIEMRDVEHSLCEWDKYERALWQEGKIKRNYRGAIEL